MKKQGSIFDLDKKKKKIIELEETMADANFWKNKDNSQEVSKKLKNIKNTVSGWEEMRGECRDLSELVEITEDNDKESINHLEEEIKGLEGKLEKLEFKRLLGGKHDANNAIISIHAGAGGTESCDWAAMLLRMYSRWAENKGYSLQTVDLLPGEEAGVKSATLIVKGDYAYGYLKAEKGVHRLVRISPFDSNSRRHTSFASIDVIPEVSEDIEIEINPKDLKIDTYRSSGAGGQHVNVTDSAVRITHLPTNIVTQCQNERSQHQNKATAMKVLKAKLYEAEKEKREKEFTQHYGGKDEIAWGSQIRSYVLHPYNMVKDHRTNKETGNTSAVLDGGIDLFIEAYLKRAKR
ncbi:MAG: peptide chain release factor 2 [Candidatus Omnitrophica bacterium]|nr:peptide chain release factor 2 [Candidatus Omnitrophota bacterium]